MAAIETEVGINRSTQFVPEIIKTTENDEVVRLKSTLVDIVDVLSGTDQITPESLFDRLVRTSVVLEDGIDYVTTDWQLTPEEIREAARYYTYSDQGEIYVIQEADVFNLETGENFGLGNIVDQVKELLKDQGTCSISLSTGKKIVLKTIPIYDEDEDTLKEINSGVQRITKNLEIKKQVMQNMASTAAWWFDQIGVTLDNDEIIRSWNNRLLFVDKVDSDEKSISWLRDGIDVSRDGRMTMDFEIDGKITQMQMPDLLTQAEIIEKAKTGQIDPECINNILSFTECWLATVDEDYQSERIAAVIINNNDTEYIVRRKIPAEFDASDPDFLSLVEDKLWECIDSSDKQILTKEELDTIYSQAAEEIDDSRMQYGFTTSEGLTRPPQYGREHNKPLVGVSSSALAFRLFFGNRFEGKKSLPQARAERRAEWQKNGGRKGQGLLFPIGSGGVQIQKTDNNGAKVIAHLPQGQLSASIGPDGLQVNQKQAIDFAAKAWLSDKHPAVYKNYVILQKLKRKWGPVFSRSENPSIEVLEDNHTHPKLDLIEQLIHHGWHPKKGLYLPNIELFMDNRNRDDLMAMALALWMNLPQKLTPKIMASVLSRISDQEKLSTLTLKSGKVTAKMFGKNQIAVSVPDTRYPHIYGLTENPSYLHYFGVGLIDSDKSRAEILPSATKEARKRHRDLPKTKDIRVAIESVFDPQLDKIRIQGSHPKDHGLDDMILESLVWAILGKSIKLPWNVCCLEDGQISVATRSNLLSLTEQKNKVIDRLMESVPQNLIFK